MQEPPHHPPGDLGVDAQQAEAVVVVPELVHEPLAQRLAHHRRRLLRSRLTTGERGRRRGRGRGGGGRRRRRRSGRGGVARGLFHLLEPDTGAVEGPHGDAALSYVAGGGASWECRSEPAGGQVCAVGEVRVVADAGGGGERGTTMPLREQIRPPAKSPDKQSVSQSSHRDI